jgi:hypothetical protein
MARSFRFGLAGFVEALQLMFAVEGSVWLRDFLLESFQILQI